MTASAKDFASTHPSEIWGMIRSGQWTGPTPGMAKGYVQANLVVLPKDWAYDFMVFAQRNPKPCPVLDITEPGDPEPRMVAPGADLRTDLPKYRVWENGKLVAEPTDIRSYWRDDLVAFLLGCSFSFESALIEASIPIRHIECSCNVPMYITNIQCKPAGRLSGPMVVSMRPIPAPMVPKAVLATGRFPAVHGAPVHIGDPALIGIKDISRPDFGDPVPINDGEIPVFWACGVTPQAALMASNVPFAITHAPGHMFICSVKDADYAVF
ncbi:putative hydro-lyase [Thermovirga lienii]|uniref:putative hydro-lyase n=1 Tax=Thermovirga lienii TaxID=336261 RepID=UPI000748D9C5|nr:MAG: Uncharacterized protein XD70_0836 [Thermovirga lienii]HCD71464.1 putative hydro-lyase [Thermovirga lienii]